MFSKAKFLGGAAVVAISMIFGAASAQAGIAGSKHDMGTGGTGLTSGEADTSAEICVFCHTPHGANVLSGSDQLPLWNRTINSYNDVTYTLYRTGDQASYGGAISTTIGGVSLLCLSCHDGTQALSSLVNVSNEFDASGVTAFSALTQSITGDRVIVDGSADSLGLSDDHPVEMVYAGDSAAGVAAGYIATSALTGPVLQANNTVTCATCHAVHNDGLGTYAFLRVSNVDSGLCQACHDK